MAISRREMEFLIRFKADASQALNQIRTQLQGVATTANKLNKATTGAGTQVAASMNAASKSTRTLNNHTNSLIGSMHALRGAVAALGVLSFSKSLIKVSTDMDSLRAKLAFTFGGNSGEVFDELRVDADRLGIRLIDLADQFGSFAAAARATGLDAKTVKDTFIGVAEATKALKLPAEQTRGALFAIQQMMAKGKVNSEEFRLQLAERLPIAMLAATRATGKTAAQFTELLENGKLISSEFVPAFAKQLSLLSQASLSFSTKSLQSELARATTLLDDFFTVIGDSGFKQGFIDLLKAFGDARPVIERLGKSFGEALQSVLDWVRAGLELLITLDKMTGGMSTNALAIGVVATAVATLLPILGFFTAGITSVITVMAAFVVQIAAVSVAAAPMIAAVLAAVTIFGLLAAIIGNITGIDIIGDSFDYVADRVKNLTKELLGFTGEVKSNTSTVARWDDGLTEVRQALVEMGEEIPYITWYLKDLQSVGSTNSASLFDTLFGGKLSSVTGQKNIAELGLKRDALNKLAEATRQDVGSLLAIRIDGKRINDLSFQEFMDNFDRIKEELVKLESKGGTLGVQAGILTQVMNILSGKIGDMNLAINQVLMTELSEASAGGPDTAAVIKDLESKNKLLDKLSKTFGDAKALDIVKFADSNKLDANNAATAKAIAGRVDLSEVFEKRIADADRAKSKYESELKQKATEIKNNQKAFLEAINSDQYDSIFFENMPGSKRMVEEAKKGLADLEEVYRKGSELGVKLDAGQLAEREARFAAHRKHIEDVLKKSLKVMEEEQREKHKEYIEMLRENPELASQATAAIEQLRFDAEQKTGVMADYFISAFDKATDALADFVTTGKFELSDFVNWAAKELAKIAIRDTLLSVANGVGSRSGGGGFSLAGVGSFLANIFHAGGTVGQGTRMRPVNPMLFAGAPRLHSGLRPDEFPAILQRGETVIPRGSSQSSFMGGGSISIPINVSVSMSGGGSNATGGATAEDAQRMGAIIADSVSTKFYTLLDKEQKPGGRLAGTRGG